MGIIDRILAISDIHGCYEEFTELLDICAYDPLKDQLVLVGDYMDRGPKSRQVLEKIICLSEEGAIVLRGNHCQMFLNWLHLQEEEHCERYFRNGGLETVQSYVGEEWFREGSVSDRIQAAKLFIKDHYRHHIEFLESTKYWHEIGKYIFIHAGIDPKLADWRETDPHDMIWIRENFLAHPHPYDRTFIHGHTPSQYLHDIHDIYFGENKIGIDGACAYGGQLNCLEIQDGSFRQFDIRCKTKAYAD